MSIRRVVARALVVLTLAVTGVAGSYACGGGSLAPVYQVSGARLSPWNGRVLADAEVRQILVRAATQRHWLVESEQPGVIFAKIVSGAHEAMVRVDYNAAGYSISYVDSSPGLRYDGQNIHRRYNHWVRGLDEAIQREFSIYEKLPTAGAEAPVAPVPEAAPAPEVAPVPAPSPEVAPAPAPATGLAPAAPAPAPAPR